MTVHDSMHSENGYDSHRNVMNGNERAMYGASVSRKQSKKPFPLTRQETCVILYCR
jgi:hypothetical protein